ncbi:MAG TPA: hypothetical protein PK874_01615 [Desulfobacteraceae bacterium]|nr:hypothetical protein [Desulfobacteraceae bacterium]HPJ67387.1 hypothetical protein [Desulfobacteraceae bacterium]HPQ28949.1 hypothetical protein [Desulfobacteraceae bacterium]
MAGSSIAGKKRIKFQIQAEEGNEVFVAGTFNGWSPRKNRLQFKDNLYTANIFLPKGRHEYKFIVNDIWCIDPECPEWVSNSFGSLNSVITVG